MLTFEVIWLELAQRKVSNYVANLTKAFNAQDAQKFYDSLLQETQKLSLLAMAYRQQKYITIKKHYRLYFKVDISQRKVFIYNFADARRIIN